MSNTTLELAFVNKTTSSAVYAYVTGLAIQNNNAVILVKSNGYYYPANPSNNGTSLAEDCAIPLGAPGSTTTVTIPQIAGGRVWFSIGAPLTFLLNPSSTGAALVNPSVTNNSDPNINISWDFCEFTFNSSQLFANISYVDFVSVPIALSLTSSSGPVQTVTGMPANGLTTVCNGLITQTAADKQPWSSLIVKNTAGQNLRALSPNNGIFLGANFTGYFEPYVEQCYSRFNSTPLTVDTQSGFGTISGNTFDTTLTLSGQQFAAPSTADIFSCSTGPFATGSNAERNAIIPRLAAAFNRSTLLTSTAIPSPASDYYKESITNHYSRIVHAANVDGIGYGFPYDDVTPDGGPDQSGKVESGTPTLFTITVGGSQYANGPDSIAAGVAGKHKAGGVSTVKSEVAQKPIGPAVTQGEETAKEKAVAASQGPTAVTKDIVAAPGPDVAPHPKKQGLLRRVLGKLGFIK
jgi:hypothetical protein